MASAKSTNQLPAGYPTANKKIGKEEDKKVDAASQNDNEEMNAEEESTDRALHAHFTIGLPYTGGRPRPLGRYPEAYDYQNFHPSYGRPVASYGYGGQGYPAHYGTDDDEEEDQLVLAHDDGGYGRPPHGYNIPQGYSRTAHYRVESYEAPPPPRRRPPVYTERFVQRNERYGY